MAKKIIISENQFKSIVKNIKNQPKLNEIYNLNGNDSNLISINETNAKRLLDRHSAGGYAIVSACRGFSEYKDIIPNPEAPDAVNILNKINGERTKKMIDEIRAAGFSYTLSYGGFIENLGTPDEESVYERGAIIYASKKDKSVDPEGMKKLALKICNEFNQDSVLVKMPDSKPQYLLKDGSVDMEFSGDIAFNDIVQEYFTDLHKNTTEKIKPGLKPTRFTFLESYIAPKPQCYSESHTRYLKGEIFLKS